LDNTCDSCRAGFQLFRVGLFVKVFGCELPSSKLLGNDGPLITPSISGEYYQRNRASKTTISLAITGTYQSWTIPPQNITISATHATPIKFSDPFVLKTCTAKINTNNCICTPCINGGRGVSIDCSALVIVPQNGVTPPGDINYPNTSSTCIGIS
jgi:hypothetical protein